MQKVRLSFTTICWLVAIVVILAECRTARAGSSGSVNGLGNGSVWSSVKSKTGVSNFVQTAQGTVLPGAIISNSLAIGFTKSGLLPSGASSLSFSQIRGEKGGILLKGTNHATTGDSDDNPELQSQVTITPVDCASVGFSSQLNQSQAEFNANGNSGTITVDATASGGTALWLRGYEYDGPLTNIPVADPTSASNACVEFLKQNGRLLFNTLLVGPFDYGDSSNSCPLILPFTLVSSNLENLIFLADTATLSFPMVLQCPPDVNVQCSDPIYYPAVSFAGCGAVTIVFNPPLPEPAGYFPAGAFPIGTTPVTVTATDSEGNTTNCTFTVTVVGTLPIPPPLPTVTAQMSVTLTNPVATQVCGGATNWIIGTTTNATTYNTQGTFTVYWTFDDGHGDVVTTNQTVIVHSTAPPVPPVIPDAIGQCSVTVTSAPVAVDPVFGNVSGQTTNSLSYTTQGTNYITWTFTDVNNNTSTAIQRVIVHDSIPPVKPTLPDVSYSVCSGGSVYPTPPTTTDNCAGVVTGTNLTSFPITTLGTNVVTWSFSDGNGNTTTAKQNIILSGLSFAGFYSPVGGTGGTCSSPLTTANRGNSLPIKFDMFCGTNLITSGTPPLVQIQAYAKNCNPGIDVVSQPAQYQNTWHYNWNTTNAPGVYKVIVVLPDGSSHYFFVSVK
jgi:hypothetical protein